MLRFSLIVLTAAALAVPVTLPNPALADKKARAAAAGAAIGLALGAIIASKRRKNRQEHWDYVDYNASFRPASGVVCFPAQRACYRNNYYSADWTHRVYGY